MIYKYFISLFVILFCSTTLSFGQVMAFQTEDGNYSGNFFLYKNRFYEETNHLILRLNLKKQVISRRSVDSIYYSHHRITWTDEIQINDHHLMWVIKTTDGWQFYINIINNKVSFLILVDKYGKEYRYVMPKPFDF